MKNIAVMLNSYKDPEYVRSRRILSQLQSLGAQIFLDISHKDKCSLQGIHYYEGNLPSEAEMILVLGGDGSVLDAAVLALDADIPLLGINLGRLGYLAELEPNEPEPFERLIREDYSLREHMTFEVSLERGGEETKLSRSAVNDVVLSQIQGGGMSEIQMEDGVGNQIGYLADGVIVATPLGSTAYSLSAGGPVIDASLSAFCVTPICAHSLFSRSVIFPPDYTITLRNNSSREADMQVTLDGGTPYLLSPGDCVKIKRSQRVLRMISLENHAVLGVLSRKMQLLNPIVERRSHEE